MDNLNNLSIEQLLEKRRNELEEYNRRNRQVTELMDSRDRCREVVEAIDYNINMRLKRERSWEE